MIKFIVEKCKDIMVSRLFWLAVIYSVLAFVLLQRMFELQIVKGEEPEEKQNYYKVVDRYIPSTRGLIYDKNGELLAYNELSFSILLEDSAQNSTNAAKNKSIHKMVSILKDHGYEMELDFAIELDENGKLQFNVSGTAEQRFKKNAYGKRSVNELSDEQKAATAEEVFQFLRSGDKSSAMFQVSDEYSLEEALDIITVRYHFFTLVDKSSQLTIASNVDDATIAAISESSGEIPGVSVVQRTKRGYNHAMYFAHIIGYTGQVTESELEALNGEDNKGTYQLSDYIGKTGLEKELESVLAGTKGIERITLTNSGKVISTQIISEPVPGQNIYLTLDVESQKVIYYIIEKNLASILGEVIVPEMDYGTKGESSEDIRIPIYEVYYALFNNNVVNINHFNAADATELELKVYGYYLNKRDSVIEKLQKHLEYGSTTLKSRLSEDMQDYLSYTMSQMIGKDFLSSEKMDSSDATYQSYINGRTSAAEFIAYSINNQWVNLDALGITGEYYSTDEIYHILLEKTFASLYNNKEFDLKLYRDLIFNYKLSGKEICLLLFDQNVLEYNEQEYSNLRRNKVSAYDFLMQKIADVEITPAQLALDPCSGTVVQTDVNTGAVTALVTYPSYDTNRLTNKIQWDYYSTLLADKSNPLYNRATQQRTTTGSTIKMMTTVSGLMNGVISINEKIYDNVIFDKIVPSPSCWSTRGHKEQDFSNAITNSCNYYFYEVGYRLATDRNGKYSDRLGISKLVETSKLFGLDSKTGLELGEAVPAFAETDAVRSSIGYGHSFTPLQISRYVNTLATQGTLYKYTLIDKITDKDGITVQSLTPVVENQITDISNKAWSKITTGMENVILKYSANLKNAYADIPVLVAGKTGSAQQGANIPPHSVFVSYAPSDNPEISVTAVIANGYSGNYSGYLCRDIYGYYYNREFRDFMNISSKEGDNQ